MVCARDGEMISYAQYDQLFTGAKPQGIIDIPKAQLAVGEGVPLGMGEALELLFEFSAECLRITVVRLPRIPLERLLGINELGEERKARFIGIAFEDIRVERIPSYIELALFIVVQKALGYLNDAARQNRHLVSPEEQGVAFELVTAQGGEEDAGR